MLKQEHSQVGVNNLSRQSESRCRCVNGSSHVGREVLGDLSDQRYSNGAQCSRTKRKQALLHQRRHFCTRRLTQVVEFSIFLSLSIICNFTYGKLERIVLKGKCLEHLVNLPERHGCVVL